MNNILNLANVKRKDYQCLDGKQFNYNQSKQQVAQRLAELWEMRENNPKEYSRNRLGEEKENIYRHYGSDNQVIEMAREISMKKR